MTGRGRDAGYLLLILAGFAGLLVALTTAPAALILVALVFAAAGVALVVYAPAPPADAGPPDRSRIMLALGACSGGLIVLGLVFWPPLWQAGLFVALGAVLGSRRSRSRR